MPHQEVNAKSRSAMFVRQIGHSEQAREQDLHTAMAETELSCISWKLTHKKKSRRKTTYSRSADREEELPQLAIQNILYKYWRNSHRRLSCFLAPFLSSPASLPESNKVKQSLEI